MPRWATLAFGLIAGVAAVTGAVEPVRACTVCVVVRGGFEVAHPDSLDVAIAIRREIDAGRLGTTPSLAPPDLLGTALVKRLAMRDGFELLLVEDGSRYRFDGRPDVRGRRRTPTRRWITGRAVLGALLSGALDPRKAIARGLMVVEGVETSTACLANEPLHRRIATQDAIALGRPIRRIGKTQARFRIKEVLSGDVSVKEVTLASDLLIPGAEYLLLSDGSALRLRPDAIAFVRKLLAHAPPAEAVPRLRYFLPFAGSSDPHVAAAVRQEFAAAPYAALKALGPWLEVDEIVKATEARGTRNLGLLVLLIGIAGDRVAIPRLEGWLADPSWQRRAEGYDALIAAYLMLRGRDGLKSVAAIMARIDDHNRGTAIRAFHAALRFHDRQEHQLPPELIREARSALPRIGVAR
jgi:hypothetical protein